MRTLTDKCNGSTPRVHNEPPTPAASPASAWQKARDHSRKKLSAEAVENAELKTENAELKTDNAKLKSRLEACAKVALGDD